MQTSSVYRDDAYNIHRYIFLSNGNQSFFTVNYLVDFSCINISEIDFSMKTLEEIPLYWYNHYKKNME